MQLVVFAQVLGLAMFGCPPCYIPDDNPGRPPVTGKDGPFTKIPLTEEASDD